MPAPFLISKPKPDLLILTQSRKYSAMSLADDLSGFLKVPIEKSGG